MSAEIDAESGRLVVKTTVAGGESARTWAYTSDGEVAADSAAVGFVNTYSASGVTAEIVATKDLSGRLMNDGEFTFELVDAATNEVVATARNLGGEVNFGSLSYTKPGTYTYEAREVTDNLPAGVTAAAGSFTLTVDVVDNGDGTLTCDVVYPDGGLAFKNTYGTDTAALEVSGTKKLDVPAALAGPEDITGKFTFTIAGEDGAPLPERTVVTNDGSNGAAFSFGKINFTLENVFGTVPSDPEAPSDGDRPVVIEDEVETQSEKKNEAQVEDVVGEKGTETEGSADPVVEPEAQAEADAVSDEPAAEPEAEPEVSAEAAAPAQPVLDTPVVSESDAAAVESAPDPVDAATVNAARWQPFLRNLLRVASDTEQRAGASRERILHYTVTETGSLPGVTNDVRSTRDVYIKVVDDGAGHLTAAFVDADGSPANPDLTFTNSYDAAPVDSSVTDQISVTKSLTGRTLAAGEFHFEMVEVNDGQVVATGTNDASGRVTLSAIRYDAPGTHAYEIREVGAGHTTDGVKYDGASFHVNTTVSDAGDGTLSVTHELLEDAAVFANEYVPTVADVALTAHKELAGAELAAGQFTFELTGEGTHLVATNDADGDVAFPHLVFSEPGEYTYEVREANDGQDGVAYDERVYTVKITVTDDGAGHLSASVETSRDGEACEMAFVNTYTPPAPPEDPKTPEEPKVPEEPKQPETPADEKPSRPSGPSKSVRKVFRSIPKTGDAALQYAPFAIAGLVIVVVALALVRRRR